VPSCALFACVLFVAPSCHLRSLLRLQFFFAKGWFCRWANTTISCQTTRYGRSDGASTTKPPVLPCLSFVHTFHHAHHSFLVSQKWLLKNGIQKCMTCLPVVVPALLFSFYPASSFPSHLPWRTLQSGVSTATTSTSKYIPKLASYHHEVLLDHSGRNSRFRSRPLLPCRGLARCYRRRPSAGDHADPPWRFHCEVRLLPGHQPRRGLRPPPGHVQPRPGQPGHRGSVDARPQPLSGQLRQQPGLGLPGRRLCVMHGLYKPHV
jgi:hypothetical protein